MPKKSSALAVVDKFHSSCLFCDDDKKETTEGKLTLTAPLTKALCSALDIPTSEVLSKRLTNSPVCCECHGKIQNVRNTVNELEKLRKVISDFKDELVQLLGKVSSTDTDDTNEYLDGMRKEMMQWLLSPCNMTTVTNSRTSTKPRRTRGGRIRPKKKDVEDNLIVKGEGLEDNPDEDRMEGDEQIVLKVEVQEATEEGGNNERKVKNKKYSCTHCSFSFQTAFDLDVHSKRIHLGVKQPFSCPFDGCKRSFRQRYLWIKHQEFHTTGVDLLKRFSCDMCSNTYETNNSLKRHLSTHTGDWKYQCSECPRGFHRPSALRVHQAKCHNAERPYPCSFCEERFPTLRKRQVHQSSLHPDQTESRQSTACSICDKVFSGKDALRCHKIQVHGEGNAPFACSECGKIFAKKSWLERHCLQHTTEKKFRCDECDESFRFPNSLQAHKLKHQNKTPFHCSVCGKGFRLKSPCTMHESTHTADKKLICEYCGKTFTLEIYLNHHRKRVHYKELGLEAPPPYYFSKKSGTNKKPKKKPTRTRTTIKKPKVPLTPKEDHVVIVQEGDENMDKGVQMEVVYHESGEAEILEEVVVGRESTTQSLQVLQLGTVMTEGEGGTPQYVQVLYKINSESDNIT